MGLVVDVGSCTECKRCMIACSLVRSGSVRLGSSRIEIQPDWPELPEIRVCRFEDCEGHPCVGSCPASAIGESDGLILIDAEGCIGCGACEAVCPYDAIRIQEEKALKCDLCGGDPACVVECVTGALRDGEVAE
ncbi:MAG: 4Fe-4S binding protein [Candidatus Bipolaricaulota bacterium]|nr:MAG: 4Fe-4S binding protein [Candidatus Bipolaricaulota bacterium]